MSWTMKHYKMQRIEGKFTATLQKSSEGQREKNKGLFKITKNVLRFEKRTDVYATVAHVQYMFNILLLSLFLFNLTLFERLSKCSHKNMSTTGGKKNKFCDSELASVYLNQEKRWVDT